MQNLLINALSLLLVEQF